MSRGNQTLGASAINSPKIPINEMKRRFLKRKNKRASKSTSKPSLIPSRTPSSPQTLGA